MEQSSLLQRYRDDRRKLLQFLLSSGLIRELRTPSGPTASLSGINLDTLSTDYILECVKSGGVIDVLEATKKYYAESAYPVVQALVQRRQRLCPHNHQLPPIHRSHL